MEKKSIIAEIFYGNRGHGETIKESKEYWNVLEDVSKLAEDLIKNLNDEQKILFKKFELSSMGLEAEAALTHFIEGFKIGLLIGKEVFEN